jgi:hypothetical protein
MKLDINLTVKRFRPLLEASCPERIAFQLQLQLVRSSPTRLLVSDGHTTYKSECCQKHEFVTLLVIDSDSDSEFTFTVSTRRREHFEHEAQIRNDPSSYDDEALLFLAALLGGERR